jgi:DNA polymerase-1
LIKIAMIRIDAAMREQRLRSRMTLQVHDELLIELPPNELDTVRPLVKEHMEKVYPLDVPLVADIGVGTNWRDLEY